MKKKYQLPKEFATKWVDALRSGAYKQTCSAAQLKSEDCYCVLGVGAVVGGFEFEDDGDNAFMNGIDIYDFVDSFGKNRNVGGNLSVTIYRLNDGDGLSFNDLADWIETNVDFV